LKASMVEILGELSVYYQVLRLCVWR